MSKFKRSDRLGVDDNTRRDFLKLMVLTGGVMGVKPWKVFEVMEDCIGSAHAQTAAGNTINKSLHINAGTGALSRFTLLWPHVEIAKAAQSMGAGILSSGIPITRSGVTLAPQTSKDLYTHQDTPWRNLPGGRQVTAMMGGFNQVHAEVAISNTVMPAGGAGGSRAQVSLFAAAAVLQNRESPAAIPVMTVDAIRAGDAQPFGAADGSGSIPVSRAADFGGLVDMLASEAAKTGHAIALPQNAALFSRYYDAVKRLDRASLNVSYRDAFSNADQALRVMVKQLATKLAPTDADVDRYLNLPAILGPGGTPTSRVNATSSRMVDFARTLILTSRAMKLGVTNMVMCPAFNDDPHGLFGSQADATDQTAMLGSALDQFLVDCGVPDPMDANSRSVADNVIVHIYGDCSKNPVVKSGWPDDPPRNSNVSFVLGQGWLKSGWFGGVTAAAAQSAANGGGGENAINLYNPLDPTGAMFRAADDTQCARLGSYVAASVLYAITNGQLGKWRQFYSGDAIPGLTNVDRA